MDDTAAIRALVETRWNPGDTGKGLLIHIDEQPPDLVSWRTLSWSGPHHLQVLTALGLTIDDVAAFLEISEEGEVDLILGDPGLIERALPLDPRLRAANGTWRFG